MKNRVRILGKELRAGDVVVGHVGAAGEDELSDRPARIVSVLPALSVTVVWPDGETERVVFAEAILETPILVERADGAEQKA